MALTRITKGVIKPNENYDTHNINSTGIVTATGANITGNLTVGGVLTYEDVTSIDSVGIITGKGADINGDLDVDGHTNLDNVSIAGVTTFSGNIGGTATFQDIDVDGHTNLDNVSVAGVITATSFRGDGSQLTGISVTSDKIEEGNSKVEVVDTGTGSMTFVTDGTQRFEITSMWSNFYTGLYVQDSSQFGGTLSVADSIMHLGNSPTRIRFPENNVIELKTDNTVAVRVDQNQNMNVAGVVTATTFYGSGANLTGVVQSDRPAGGSSESEIFFEVDTGVSISTTTTLSRASSNPGRIFTKVKEIVVGTSSPSSVELIVSANEELVVDYFDVIT